MPCEPTTSRTSCSVSASCCASIDPPHRRPGQPVARSRAVTSPLFDDVLEALARHGLLLLASDSLFPSVVSLIAGEQVRGSWWGHPLGHTIFRIASELDDHPDVLSCKLLAGKVTFVHRRLWPELQAVAL